MVADGMSPVFQGLSVDDPIERVLANDTGSSNSLAGSVGLIVQHVEASGNSRQHVGHVIHHHHHPERVEATPSPQSTVPFDRDSNFVGRKELLDELHNIFAHQDRHNRAVLQGLGGNGYAVLSVYKPDILLKL